LLRHIRARSIEKQLEKDTPKPYCLNGVKISGKLNLKHRIIKRPVEIHGAEFLDEVDLRYCEFKQAVDLSECTFHKGFNSGDEIESHTIYRSDFICNRANFKGAAQFNAAQFHAAAYFHTTIFENREERVEFTAASLGGTLECQQAIFKGPTSFNAIRCGRSGFFEGAEFESEKPVNFRYASFELNLRCAHATFRGDVDFSSLKCGANLYCQHSEFLGNMDARRLTCSDSAIFFNSTFEDNEVDFRFIHCGGNLDFRGAYFAGSVRLAQAHISQRLRLGGSCFMDTVELYDATIKILELMDENPRSTKAVFVDVDDPEKQIKQLKTLKALKEDRGWQGHKLWTKFTRITKYYKDTFESLSVNCYKDRSELVYEDGHKQALTSQNEVDDGLLVLDAVFKNEDGLQRIEFTFLEEDIRDRGDKVDRPRAERQLNDLLGAVEDVLERREYRDLKKCILESFFPFKARKRLDLTETTFEVFHGSPKRLLWRRLATKLVDDQNPEKFSRDPYLQLEKYYDNIGYEVEAGQIHYKGHCDLRNNAKLPSEKGRVKWSKRKNAADLFFKWTVGYGHRKIFLVGWIFFFLLLGTLLFWWSGLEVNELAVHSEAAVWDTRATSTQEHSWPDLFLGHFYFWPDLWYCFVYSLDVFIPVVDLGYANAWEPILPGVQIYVAIHAISGWIFIVLLLASLTGLIKNE
jgi:hypothetical protein